jgi:hypothetical protein
MISPMTKLLAFSTIALSLVANACSGGDEEADGTKSGGDGDGDTGHGAGQSGGVETGLGGESAAAGSGPGGSAAVDDANDTFCAAEKKSCMKETLATCNDDGSGYVAFETCPVACELVGDSAACTDGNGGGGTGGGNGTGGDTNLVNNGDFATSDAWLLSVNVVVPPTIKDGMACLSAGDTLGYVGLEQLGLSLDAGDYVLTYDVVATVGDEQDPPSVEAKISPMKAPWMPVYGTEDMQALSTGTSAGELTFNLPTSVTELGIAFNIEVFSGDEVCIDNVKLAPL